MADEDQGGAIILDEGGAGGGGEEVGGGDDSEVIESEGIESEGDEAGGDEDTEGDKRGDREEDPAPRGDRRTLPVEVRKALREVATKDPEFAKRFPRFEKEITGALFTRQQVNDLGGMQSISNTLETLETLGGLEGVEQMATDLEAARGLEAGLERGDPKTLESWAKDYPDGFKRSVLPMIDALEKLDEERFEHVSSAVISRVFEKFGVFGGVSALGKALTDGKVEDATKHFNELVKFLGEAKSLAGRAKSDPYASRSAELDNREKSITERDATQFKGGVRSDVNTQVTSAMNSQLRDHLRSLKVFKVESGTANRMRKEINRELQRLVNSDPMHAKRYDAVMQAGDRDRAVKFIMAAAMKRLPEAIKSVAKDFNLRPTGRAGASGGNARQRSSGARGGGDRGERGNFVSGVPKTSEVNFRAIDKAQWLVMKSQPHGKVPLLNGKWAQW